MNNNTIPRDVMIAYATITEDVELFNAISKDMGKVINIEEKRKEAQEAAREMARKEAVEVAREIAREMAASKPEPKPEPKDAKVTTESSKPNKAEKPTAVPGTEKYVTQQKAAVEAAKNISEKPTAVPGTEKYIKQQKAIVAEKAVQDKKSESVPEKEESTKKAAEEKPVQQKKPQQKPENKSETREDKLKKVRQLIKEGKGPVTPLKEMSYTEKVDLIKESVELRDGHKLSPVEIDTLVNTFCTERIKNHVKNKYSIINPKWVELHPEDVTMSNKKDYDMFFKVMGTKVYMAVNLVPYYNKKGNWTNDCKIWSTEAPANK